MALWRSDEVDPRLYDARHVVIELGTAMDPTLLQKQALLERTAYLPRTKIVPRLALDQYGNKVIVHEEKNIYDDDDEFATMGAGGFGLGLGLGAFALRCAARAQLLGWAGLMSDGVVAGVAGGPKGANVVGLVAATPVLAAAPVQNNKKVRYAQPVVTYAQPVVQQVDMSAPVIPTHKKTAAPIIQPTFQTAPVQQAITLSATAPTIQKGFGAGLNNLGGW